MNIYEGLIHWFDIKSYRILFKNRASAGQILGRNLEVLLSDEISCNKNPLTKDSLLVIGIANGGLVVANEVARILKCDLDIIAPIRILSRDEIEHTIGAILYVKYPTNLVNLIRDEIGNTYYVILKKGNNLSLNGLHKIDLLNKAFEKSKKYSEYKSKSITNKIVILVDDGTFSGATAFVSLTWIAAQRPRCLIFATPVASLEVAESIARNKEISVSHMEMLKKASFSQNKSIGSYYESFEHVDDTLVKQIMDGHTVDT
ncbi:MAG: hypothetical protein L0H55_07620 [Candidatus Nitrosocosmicus sp.]|nr:hypothetical protein [Candidatus Nitrosocosmicus sp.]